MTRADGANAAAVQAKVKKALGQVGEGAEIIIQRGQAEHLRPGSQIRAARKLLGWHRSIVAAKARGITGNTVGKVEGAYPGKLPTDEQLAEIKRTLKAAGVEFTEGASWGFCEPRRRRARDWGTGRRRGRPWLEAGRRPGFRRSCRTSKPQVGKPKSGHALFARAGGG